MIRSIEHEAVSLWRKGVIAHEREERFKTESRVCDSPRLGFARHPSSPGIQPLSQDYGGGKEGPFHS
ncbi:MAG: hypothetical protein GX849_03370 [Clostridiaceae bacterium]|jgi:hypothetical protein|nr:hypothetical protein [Clostridiaceae bacterium]